MSDPGGTSPAEWAGIVVAGGGVLALIGTGFRWLLTWGDTRREKRELELDEGWRALRKRMEDRLAALEARDERREQQLLAIRLAYENVAGELRRHDPQNLGLRRAEQLMSAAFPLDPGIPRDMADQLHRLNGASHPPFPAEEA